MEALDRVRVIHVCTDGAFLAFQGLSDVGEGPNWTALASSDSGVVRIRSNGARIAISEPCLIGEFAPGTALALVDVW